MPSPGFGHRSMNRRAAVAVLPIKCVTLCEPLGVFPNRGVPASRFQTRFETRSLRSFARAGSVRALGSLAIYRRHKRA